MNQKAIIFLADGMADLPLPELGGKTPLEYAHTPAMDEIARLGSSGTFFDLAGWFADLFGCGKYVGARF